MLQLLVNKFTILEIEEYTEEDSDISNIPVYLFYVNFIAFARYFKWKKRLLLYQTINVLNIHRISLYLSIVLETTDISELFSVKALANSEATEIFIS